MKKNHITLIMLALAFATIPSIRAQRLGSNDVFFHSFRSPLATRLNPAAFPDSSKWYVTLPRVDAGLTMPVSYNDFGLQYDASRDTTVFNINDFLNTLDSCGSQFNINADVDLIGFGFKVGRLSFNAATGVRVTSGLCVPLGATQLVTDGNVASETPIEMGCENFFNIQAFGHISLGAAYALPQIPLTVGGRVNLLDGLATLSANDLSMKLTTSDGGQMMQVSADYLMHMAGMAYLEENADGEMELAYDTVSFSNLPAPNWGCTFDLGATYQLGNVKLSASLLDIGPGVHWTKHPSTIVPKHQNATLSFDGLDLSSLLTNGSLDTAFASNLKDSLLSLVDYQTEYTDFWAGVPTRIYVGASYSLGKLLRVGYLLHGEWDRGLFDKHSTFRCNNTLSATANLFDWFDLTLANAVSFDGSKADFFNPGISASLNIGRVVQMYLALDYVSNIYATDLKAARFFLGLNIVGYSK